MSKEISTSSESTTAVTTQQSESDTARLELQTFERGLLSFLNAHGLPSDGVLVPVSERGIVFSNIDAALASLPDSKRKNSLYLSKYLSAVASGLFDAALNYLWDETISELRDRVAQYDISYFFDIAVTNTDKRKDFKTEGDLQKLDDYTLIAGARAIELVSEIGYKHLDYIRSMRNWASAAHPNQHTLTGLQLLSWLQTCINEVISLPPSNVVVEIGRLLANVRTSTISDAEARGIAAFTANLTQEQVSRLVSGFYGIYTRSDTTSQTRDNIHRLMPYLWDRTEESTRQQLGIRYGRLMANSEQAEAQLSRQFLEMVSGQAYIPDSLRAAEIESAVENLLSAHRAVNNFYNEPTFARALSRLIGQGSVPNQINKTYVLGVVEAYLTNGNGIARSAEPIYLSLLDQFDQGQALIAITSFMEERIASRLRFTLCHEQFIKLLKLMRNKTPPAVQELIDVVEMYKGPFDKMRDDSTIRRKVSSVQKVLQ